MFYQPKRTLDSAGLSVSPVSSSGPQPVQSALLATVPQTVLEHNLHLVVKCMSLFISGGTGSSSPSLAVASRGPSLGGVRGLPRGGFSSSGA